VWHHSTNIGAILVTIVWYKCSWIYNYLCNQCLSPLTFETRSWRGVFHTTLCDKVCQWLMTGQWFSPSTPNSSTNKTDSHIITEILLKEVLNTKTLSLTQYQHQCNKKYHWASGNLKQVLSYYHKQKCKISVINNIINYCILNIKNTSLIA
jgi:hypothetical protein